MIKPLLPALFVLVIFLAIIGPALIADSIRPGKFKRRCRLVLHFGWRLLMLISFGAFMGRVAVPICRSLSDPAASSPPRVPTTYGDSHADATPPPVPFHGTFLATLRVPTGLHRGYLLNDPRTEILAAGTRVWVLGRTNLLPADQMRLSQEGNESQDFTRLRFKIICPSGRQGWVRGDTIAFSLPPHP